MASRRTPGQGRARRPGSFSQLASVNANVTSAIGMGETVGRLRARRNSLFTRTIIWITVLVCIAFLIGSLAQAWSNSQLQQQVQVAQQQLQQDRAHHDALTKLAKHYNDPSVIESEARQQLGYVRPGEHVVVVVNDGSTSPTASQRHKGAAQPLGFWQQWWQAFFGN